jgi:hypothetical protein
MAEQSRIVTELEALQAEVDALKRLQTESRQCLHPILDTLLPAILDRAWTPSLPARSGYALSLREMDLLVPTRSALRAFVPQGGTNSFHRLPSGSSHLARSQRARLKGEL